MSSSDLDRDALFSLELVIDRLVLSDSVICRLPAIAFRLLDYPTLLIHLVEPDAVDELRAVAFASYSSTGIPLQLPQLLNGNGEGFHFHHGKSCLLRMSPSAMRAQLGVMPLYVSVVDIFPKVPKLVGSSFVPLEQCMNRLYSEIVSRGVSMPTVSAESCEVDVSNLNGDRLGTAFIRFRLLFLGSSLLAHIPGEGLTSESKLKVEKDLVNDESLVLPLGASTGTELKIQFDDEGNNLERPLYNDRSKEQDKLETVATQTSSKNGRYSLHCPTIKREYWEDSASSNMLCPPPLFYHSSKSSVRTFQLPEQNWSVIWENANTDEADFMSDDETIRSKDNSMELDEKAAHNSLAVKSDQEAALDSKHSKYDATSGGAITDMKKFPLLNALISEVLRLQGMNLVAIGNTPGDEAKKYTLRRRESMVEKTLNESIEVVPTVVRNDSSLQKRIESTAPIPKDISWTGRRSSVNNSSASSLLVAGMTNTQRLRLSKRNPRLLEELEIQEARRRSDFKAALKTRRKNSVKSEGKESTTTAASPELIERLKFTDEARNEGTEYDHLAESFDSKKSTGPYKLPVPTPRTSKPLLRENENDKTDNLVDIIRMPKSSHFDGTKTYSVVPRSESPRSVQHEVKTRLNLDEDQATRITKPSSIPNNILSTPSNEHRSDARQAEAFGVTQVLSVSSSSKKLSSLNQASDANVFEMASDDLLKIEKPVDSNSQDEVSSNNEEDLDRPTSLEERGQQKDAEQQPADLVENRLDGLKQIIDRYSGDSGEDDESEPDTFTGSQTARSGSSGDSNHSNSRSSGSQRSSERGFSTSIRRIADSDYGRPIRPLGSQDVPSPRTIQPKGDQQRQSDFDVDQSASRSYSEIFEEPSDNDDDDDDDDDQVNSLRLAREARPVREAKLGYTWAP